MKEKYNINQTTLNIIGAYTGDYLSQLHLRQIARYVNVDVKAVQMQLKKLEGLNIVQSNVKGKNKEYSINLDNPLAKYYLILSEIRKSIMLLGDNFTLKKIVKSAIHTDIGSFVFFGSYAKGNPTKESDIDIMLIGYKDPKKAIDSAKSVSSRVSIKVMSNRAFSDGLFKKDPLVVEVLRNHVIAIGAENFCGILWDYYAKI